MSIITANQAATDAITLIQEEFKSMQLDDLSEEEKKQTLWNAGISKMLYATYFDKPDDVDDAIMNSSFRRFEHTEAYTDLDDDIRDVIKNSFRRLQNETYDGFPLFWMPIYFKQHKTLYTFLIFEVDVNVYYKGNTALHLAIEMGRLSAVRDLINYHADFNAKNGNGETPLDLAQRLYKNEKDPYDKDTFKDIVGHLKSVNAKSTIFNFRRFHLGGSRTRRKSPV
uniref:Uncharacterized protein n=1 Tax=viral metagenome TaxID=1070528 RepID=A0A6C0I5R9_9ZZZZ